MITGPCSTVAECDDALAKVRQARLECCGDDRALLCMYDDLVIELEARKAALPDDVVPEQR